MMKPGGMGQIQKEDMQKDGVSSGVARAFPGGQVAHKEGQNEDEKEKSLRKIKKKIDQNLGKKEESGTLAHLGL